MQVQGSSISKNSCQTKLQPEIRVLRAWHVYVCQKGSQCSLDVRLEILHHLESEEAIRLSIGLVARKLEYRHIYNLLEASEETSMFWRPARRQPCPWWWTERMCQRQGHKRRRRQKVRSVAGCSHDLNEKKSFQNPEIFMEFKVKLQPHSGSSGAELRHPVLQNSGFFLIDVKSQQRRCLKTLEVWEYEDGMLDVVDQSGPCLWHLMQSNANCKVPSPACCQFTRRPSPHYRERNERITVLTASDSF